MGVQAAEVPAAAVHPGGHRDLRSRLQPARGQLADWQEGAHGGRLAGDPIIRDIHYHRYLTFFYCNATAFAASLVVIVLILILAVRHDKERDITWVASEVKPLQVVMVLDLVSLVGAYSAGTCRDKIYTVYSAVLVAIVFIYVLVLKFRDWWSRRKNSGSGSGAMTVEEKKMMRLRAVTLLKASPLQPPSTHSRCSGGNPRSGYPGSDDGGTLGVALPHEGIVLEQLLDGGRKEWSGVHLLRRR